MARDDDSAGFSVGLLLGGALGFLAGAWLASGPGRSQVDNLRERTIELTSRNVERARDAMNNPEHPFGRAVQDGLSAARERRDELEGGAEGGSGTGTFRGEGETA